MKKLSTVLALLLSVPALATTSKVYLTIGSDVVRTQDKSLQAANLLVSQDDVSLIEVDASKIEEISHMVHENFHRCGGFIFHETLEDAKKTLKQDKMAKRNSLKSLVEYSITQEEQVRDLLNKVDEFAVRSTILKLSSFKNRYYDATTGVESQAWLKSHWEAMAQGRSDVKVEYFNHRNWAQPSVILTIEGVSKNSDIIVVGGHADSIAGMWGSARARAPGADDNASGIASVTEAARVLLTNGHRPSKTVKFMAYAAEEVGLRGSKEIAESFKRDGKNVIGVMQLDMTNHNGSRDLDIVFMRDYTNAAQNAFLGQLIDKYVHVPWGYSQCGYGCSDHASWHNQGFAASIPFESTMEDINRKIHTADDVIENSNSNADHAEKFSKLAVAFIVEMAK